MSARATASGPISFGMVSIPVKYYKAASPEEIHFKMISENGNPVKQKLVETIIDTNDQSTKEVEVNRSLLNKGFEYEPGKFVVFTEAEIKALESGGTKGCLNIEKFIPMESVDLVRVETSYYVKPDKGGDRAFSLLASAIKNYNVSAIGRWTNRGKDHLVLLRSYKGGMIMHTLFLNNEVRDYDNNCTQSPISEAEMTMAGQIIDHFFCKDVDLSQYNNTFSERVVLAVAEKRKNPAKTITESISAAAPALDLFAALQATLASTKPQSILGDSDTKSNDIGALDKQDKKTQTRKVSKKR